MTTLSPREMLQAFDEGLEAASRSAKSKTTIKGKPSRNHIIPKSILGTWTVRIIGNTSLKTLRKTYGDQFASSYRGDTKLSTLLEREGVKSLHQYMEGHRAKKLKGRLGL